MARSTRQSPLPDQGTLPIDRSKLTGVVARVVVDRGFCFLKCDQDGQDYFCHLSALQDPLTLAGLRQGQAVGFVGTETPKGFRAESVYAR